MSKKLKTALIFMCVPAVLNLSVSMYLYLGNGGQNFQGYLTGTVLSILLSFFWIWQVSKGISSNTMVLLKVTFWGFVLKLSVLCLVAFGGYRFFGFNRFYFAAAFLIGIIFTVMIEIWFYISSLNEEKVQ